MGLLRRLGDLTRAAAHRIETPVDAAWTRAQRRFGWLDPVHILPYRSFGNAHALFVHGRVLEAKHTSPPSETDSRWKNLVNIYRRFATNEIPDVTVRAEIGGSVGEVVTDEEGYFELILEPRQAPRGRAGWAEVSLSLTEEVVQGQGAVTAAAPVLLPTDRWSFGVISDVDDTIMHSGATSKLRMTARVVVNNAHTRRTFAGVAALYHALQAGAAGDCGNPLFYVSSSPWNMYDLFRDFLDHRGIPAGPIMLRDFGLQRKHWVHSDHSHKQEKIDRILATYPDLPFVLLGDSGQDDPSIYRDALLAHPDRIKAAYIRDTTVKGRDALFHEINGTLPADRRMVLAADSAAVAAHAAEWGLISPAAAEAVAQTR